MRNILIVCILALFAMSCANLEKPPVIEARATNDTIPTITISGDTDTTLPVVDNDTDLNLHVIGNRLMIVDSTGTVTDKDISGRIRTVFLALDENNVVTRLVVNGEYTMGEKYEHKPPFKMIGDGLIRVLEGATLEHVSRYYGRSMEQLKICNPTIKDADYIQAGQKIKLDCLCATCLTN